MQQNEGRSVGLRRGGIATFSDTSRARPAIHQGAIILADTDTGGVIRLVAYNGGGIAAGIPGIASGERLVENRTFVDHTEAMLRRAVIGMPVQMLEVWTSEDVRAGRAGEHWLNAVAVWPA